MARVHMQVARRKRRKKVLKRARGFWGARGKLFKTARETLLRADAYAYRDRRQRKRDFRRLWIQRINAAARNSGLSYSTLIAGLKRAQVTLDRKMLAAMAVEDPAGFAELVGIAKQTASG